MDGQRLVWQEREFAVRASRQGVVVAIGSKNTNAVNSHLSVIPAQAGIPFGLFEVCAGIDLAAVKCMNESR